MKKSTKIAVVLFSIFLITYFVFQNRISGTYQVYLLITNTTHALNEGANQYNLMINAGICEKDKVDTVTANFSFKKGDHFIADVMYNKDRYTILHEGDSTKVIISNPGLVIQGRSDTIGHFDLPRLAGNILEDYPGTSFVSTLSWADRVAVSSWLLFNGQFSKKKMNDKDYLVVSVDQDLVENVELWMDTEQNEYIIKDIEEDKEITISIRLTDSQTVIPELHVAGLKRINVHGDELNTAIYRGTMRAGGLLLENMNPPETDGIEHRWHKGLLTYVDGNRVFIAKGTHYEIGEAHGTLLKDEVRKMVDATLYTINWVYTIEKGSWFIDDLRGAYKREAPFIPEKYQEEMKGMAKTSGISLEEIRLTNVFPALFHCSGFALFGDATVDGTLYHGRILDYITELGLQYYSVVMILKPEGSLAFANISFAGFIGSVTGMNEQQVTFGEMGGGGVGDWDGMPMAFLMREGMERASTLKEAVDIFKETPRTCEYYYVLSDGKIPDGRGLATTPEKFDVIKPGEYNELLTEPIKDAVLMSAGDRYKKLAERVKAGYGKIDAQKAIRLMDRPVAMSAALHTVLFAPQTLEFWVANAGAHTPASMEPYTHYNMMELLKKLEE